MSHWPMTVLNGLTSLIGLFLPILLSRILPAQEIGLYKIFFLYLMTIPAVSLSGGIENGIYFWGGRGEEGRAEIRSAWSLAICHSLLFSFLLLLAAPFMIQHFQWSTGEWLAFWVASLTNVLPSLYEATCIARRKVWLGAIFSSGFDLAKTVAILLAVVIWRSAAASVWAYAAVCMVKVAISYYLGRRENIFPTLFDASRIKPVWRYYFPVSVSGIFDLLLNYSDKFILSALIPVAQFAVYTFGCLAIPPLQILERSVNKVLIPVLAERQLQGRLKESWGAYQEAVSQIMMITIPAVFGLFFFAEPIIRLLFTEKYLSAVPFLRVFSCWYLLAGIPYDVVARAQGDSHWILRLNVVMGLFSLLLCSLMTWQFQAMGALVSVLLVLAMQRAYGLFSIHRRTGWHWLQMIPVGRLLQFGLMSAVLSMMSLLFEEKFSTPLLWLLFCGSGFAVVYAIFIWFFHRDLVQHIRGNSVSP